MRTRILTALAPLFVTAATMTSAAPPTAWHLNKDDSFFAEWNTIAVQQLRVGMQYTQRMRELTVVARIRVEQSNADHIELDMHIGHVEVRSAGPPAPPTPADLLRGARVRVRLSTKMVIESLEGLELLAGGPADRLPPGQRRELLTALHGELTEWLNQLFVPVPADGTNWSQTIQPPSTPGFQHCLTYKTAEGESGRYTVSGHRHRNDDPARVNAESLEVVTEGYEGTLRFDLRLGRLIESNYVDRAEVRGTPPGSDGPKSFSCAVRAVGSIRVSETNPLETDPASAPPVAANVGHHRSWTNSLGMVMVELPPGRVTMGRRDFGSVNRDGPFEATITRPFSIGAHEVTIGQYRQFVAETGYRTAAERSGLGAFGFNKANGKLEPHRRFSWANPGWDHNDLHPAVNLSWEDARAFCDWLGQKEGKPYRLPTEAEWEYAARAGATTAYFSGDEPESLREYGNIVDAAAKKVFPQWQAHNADDGYVFTAPVGSFKPNAFGLYDMIGNALEWCEDWAWLYPRRGNADPQGPAIGVDRVQRGGSFADFPHQCTAGNRMSFRPEEYCVSSGFRVALSDRPPAPFQPTSSWRGRTVLPRDARVLAAMEMHRGSPRPYGLPTFHVADERLGLLRLIAGAFELGAPSEDFIPIEEAEAHFTALIEKEPSAEHYFLRAAARNARGDRQSALADLDEVIRDDHRNPWIRCARARILIAEGRFADAQRDLEAAVDLREKSPYTHNALAWLLATCPDDQVRDGKAALIHAKQAYDLTTRRDGNVLDTLAAAHAECGDFEQAIKAEEEALKDSTFRAMHEDKARERIELYRNRKALRVTE